MEDNHTTYYLFSFTANREDNDIKLRLVEKTDEREAVSRREITYSLDNVDDWCISNTRAWCICGSLFIISLMCCDEIELPVWFVVPCFICFCRPCDRSFALYPTLLVVDFLEEFLKCICDVNVEERAALLKEEVILLRKGSCFFSSNSSLLWVLRR